jgi:pimeloyl-ACP methyl ester carboxylesterase
MPRRLLRILLILLLVPPAMAAVMGWMAAPSFLHPVRRPLTLDLIREADAAFARVRAHRQDVVVTAPDGVALRGWKVRAAEPNGAWKLLFHGVADNRLGAIGPAELLLRAGFSVAMMNQRAHGESGGAIATYGWLERNDTRAVVDALVASEHPAHIFSLGESMGAGIALQSAGIDPRIEAVVAEAPFASLREASYDYAGLQEYPLLGKTLFAPGAWMMLYRGGKAGGISGRWCFPGTGGGREKFPPVTDLR